MDFNLDALSILWVEIETSQMNHVTDNKETHLGFKKVQLKHAIAARVIPPYRISTQ